SRRAGYDPATEGLTDPVGAAAGPGGGGPALGSGPARVPATVRWERTHGGSRCTARRAAGRRARRRRTGRVGGRTRMKAVVLAVLSGLALVLGGGGFHLCGALEEANDAAEDRRAAVQVAKAHAMHLMSISHDSVDQDIRRLLATSTGPAKEAYTRNAAKLKATTVDDKVVQTGVLRAAGLVS